MRSQLLMLTILLFGLLPQKGHAEAVCLPEDRLKSSKEIVQKFRSGGEFGRVTLFNESFKDQNIEVLKTGNVNFVRGGWDGLNIRNSEFTRAYFTAFTFKDVKMTHVDLRGSHFRQTNLDNVHFTDVDARAIQMDNVNLNGVHWDGVKLKGASIIFSKFKNCKFENMDWNKVVLVGTTFENCTGAPAVHQVTHQAQK
jgi:uncharacterized protein YjbI with pentapeptide repeats